VPYVVLGTAPLFFGWFGVSEERCVACYIWCFRTAGVADVPYVVLGTVLLFFGWFGVSKHSICCIVFVMCAHCSPL
jgi:ammonia channel protein AmtB